jgi:hypothetical protein
MKFQLWIEFVITIKDSRELAKDQGLASCSCGELKTNQGLEEFEE